MENNIGDILNAISVLLIFIIGFFNYLAEKTNARLKESKPQITQEKALLQYRKDLLRILRYLIALSVFITLVLLSMLGIVIKILSTSYISFMNNDVVSTLFCLIYTCIIITLILSLRTIFAILKRIK